ncbi:glycoside hydrolase family 3 C-terminal domain-containing protein [Escherichia coli]
MRRWKATGKPLVLVLMNGRPLALVKRNQQADAILEACVAGTEGGNAIADVLFGDTEPVRQAANVLPAFCRANPGVLQPSEYRSPV